LFKHNFVLSPQPHPPHITPTEKTNQSKKPLGGGGFHFSKGTVPRLKSIAT